jgi:hypothetical protein
MEGMVSPPVCPSCGSLAVGEKCGTCGTAIKRPSVSAVVSTDDRPSISIGPLPLESMDTTPKAAGLESQRKPRQAAAYLQLQESEQAVLHAASRIFAAFVASGAVTEQNQHAFSDRSVQLATRMAVVVEKYVQSDNEDW